MAIADTPSTAGSVARPDPGAEAYARTAADREAIDLRHAPRYTLDATHAFIVATGIARRLEPFRAQLAALPEFDGAILDRLADYANALHYVHIRLFGHWRPDGPLEALAAEGRALRKRLFRYADLLVLDGAFPPDVLARLRRGRGYLDLMADLGSLAIAYQDRPEVCGPGAPVTRAHVDRAEQIANAMSDAFAVRDDPDAVGVGLAADRRKLGVLLMRAHREVRFAMEFLRRHHGDARRLVPPLHVPRGKRRDDPTDDASTDPA